MSKNCIYCKAQLSDSSVFDVCQTCGFQVWGEKMYNTIIKNMEGARDSGDLYQGSVSTPLEEKPKIIPFVSQTVSEEVPKTTLKEELPKAEDLLRKNELSTENEFAFAPKIEEPTILQDSGW